MNYLVWQKICRRFFQELGSVYECCSFNCVIPDSATLSALWQWWSGKDVDRTVKKFTTLEKRDCKLLKAQIDVEFLSDSRRQSLSSQINIKSFNQTCCHLNLAKAFLDFQANYRVQIHSKNRTWHDTNIQS